MKRTAFSFLLLALIFFSFLNINAFAQSNIDLPDISIINKVNPVPAERKTEHFLGRDWNTVDLEHYKVYYLSEKNFPANKERYEQYIKNVNFLLPRLDNVYIFLSKWINVDLGTNLKVCYIADKEQLMAYSLANNINENINKTIEKSMKILEKDPKNKYWLNIKDIASSLHDKHKEVKDITEQVVANENILRNMFIYKKEKFVDWLLSEDERNNEFEKIFEIKNWPPSTDLKTKKIELLTDLSNNKKDFALIYRIYKYEIRKELLKKNEQIAELLFNNNPYYLAKIMDIDMDSAEKLLKIEKFKMKCAQFFLFQYFSYFNYAQDTPAIDLHESTHIFICRKQFDRVDARFLHEPLCSYFHFKVHNLFDCIRKDKKIDPYKETLEGVKRDWGTFDFYLKNSPFTAKGQYNDEIRCTHFLYTYLEQKDKNKFYDFLQYLLGNEDKKIKPLSASQALYKSYNLTVDQLNLELKNYYDTGEVKK